MPIIKSLIILTLVNYILIINCLIPNTNTNRIDYVNTYIGTSFWDDKDESSTESYGNTHLQVGIPMAHSPLTSQTRSNENKCESPYYYNDKYFKGVRKTHWMSGSCVVDYGTTTILPSINLNLSEALNSLVLNHEDEVTTPAVSNK